MSQIYFLSERLTEAKEDFEKSISLNENFIPAKIQLAYCIYKSAALQQSPILAQGALEMLRKTVQDYPDSADAHSLFAQVCKSVLLRLVSGALKVPFLPVSSYSLHITCSP